MSTEKTTIKLTERAIERLRAPHPSGKQTIYWDSELKGFAVMCSGTTSTKSYIVQRKLPGGRTRRVTIEKCNAITLDKASTEAADLLHAIRKGDDPKAGRLGAGMTLRKALDDYLAARANLSDKSRADYRGAVERHLASWLDRPMREITPEMVEARHRDIKRGIDQGAEANEGRSVKVTGDATANAAMQVFRLLWNHVADRVPDMPTNPVRRLRRAWFPVERRERMVGGDALPAFYKAVNALANRLHRDYLTLLLFTGLRRTEAAALAWDDIDFAARMIRLPAKRTKARRKLDLPMSDFVRDLLVARRAIGKDGPYVFAADSKAGHIAEPKFPLAEVAKACGVRVSVHDLRRTFITVAEGADISPLALKGLVNHSLGNDVTSGYVIATGERLREPAQRVANRLKELCGIKAPPKGGKVAKLDAGGRA